MFFRHVRRLQNSEKIIWILNAVKFSQKYIIRHCVNNNVIHDVTLKTVSTKIDNVKYH